MRTLLALLFILALTCTATASSKPVLRLSGPPIMESVPLLALSQDDQPWAQGFDGQFIPWHSPDMLRAMVAGGQVDAAIVTTAVAAMLRSKGVKCRVALLHEAPVWIISTRQGPASLDSLKGTLLFPFGPGEMPELFFKATMADSSGTVMTRHTGGALEAVNLLLAGQGDHAMLSDPTASIAIQRSRSMQDKGVPQLVKRVDMRTAWQEAFPGHHLAASCVAFFGEMSEDSRLIQAFNMAHEHACDWVQHHPKATQKLLHQKFPALAAQVQHGAIQDLAIRTQNGPEAVTDALFYLSKIYALSPAAVGGSMPDKTLFETGQ
ncbi:hypothetical protein GO013_03425 [Pseudodesulfovibrio sp. JC047]|uniref:hypothetical protein n=1 Tax=Pseudodesulfovibrio sp. JC047 TaxID=2683199 RepID=UPI0013D75F17|nr:hypothetical protein [Pseudodesulfovibrio sp. JC047]NDV18468.1 hypothetical protein [Pseudodesulfovibrio sp. JC047]